MSLTLCSAAIADPLPGDALIDDLELTRAWVVEVDGEAAAGAQVYYSEYEVAWLLEVPGQGSLLLSPRGENSVQRIDEKAFTKKAGVEASLEASDANRVVATFTQSRQVITFDLDDHTFVLQPAPPVLGQRSGSDLGARHPDFGQKAAAYRQKAALRAAPVEKAAAEDVTVRVYFGSWSPICERIVPKIMAVEEAWRHVRFEYYGLPQPLTDDPYAVDQHITGVPTVVVLRGGQELDRLTGRQLDSPEEAIARVLSGN